MNKKSLPSPRGFPGRGLSACLLALAAFGLSTSLALAAERGGFSGPGPALVTLKQALEMPDDANVTLKGKIVKILGDDSYVFQDATGTIEVEIDHGVWRGQNITPEDVVVITGGMDKDWNHKAIDVSSLTKE